MHPAGPGRRDGERGMGKGGGGKDIIIVRGTGGDGVRGFEV